MKNKISEMDVLQLFEGIKDAENNYPQDLIEARRASFAKQAAAMAVLMKAGVSGASTTGAGQATTTSTTTGSTAAVGGMSMGTLLETILVIALVAESGVAAYIYREKIADFFNPSSTPKVEQSTNPNNDPSQNFVASDEPIMEATETPELTITVTTTVIETPVTPDFISSTPQNIEQNGDVQVASTPVPTDSGNGLHLGQTKQPTKENKNNNDNNPNNNSNKSKDNIK